MNATKICRDTYEGNRKSVWSNKERLIKKINDDADNLRREPLEEYKIIQLKNTGIIGL